MSDTPEASRFHLKEFHGKTVLTIERQTHGHSAYAEYLVLFTDGSQIRFQATSRADVIAERLVLLPCLKAENSANS